MADDVAVGLPDHPDAAMLIELEVELYVAAHIFVSSGFGQGIEDTERAALALRGMEGKRLTYRSSGRVAA